MTRGKRYIARWPRREDVATRRRSQQKPARPPRHEREVALKRLTKSSVDFSKLAHHYRHSGERRRRKRSIIDDVRSRPTTKVNLRKSRGARREKCHGMRAVGRHRQRHQQRAPPFLISFTPLSPVTARGISLKLTLSCQPPMSRPWSQRDIEHMSDFPAHRESQMPQCLPRRVII